jgi:hypothetical protein
VLESAVGLGAERAGTARIALASLIGTAIEFYDFYIFGTAAALVFGPMFFPRDAPETQMLSAYLTFGIASSPGRSAPSCSAISVTGSGASRRWSPPC